MSDKIGTDDLKTISETNVGVDDVVSCEAAVFDTSLSPQENRRVLRKIDLCILPILFVSYMVQYLDKSAMSNSAILGLQTDLHLVGQQYSWASSIFYFGYLAASAPIAFMIVRYPIGKFMSVSVVLWAAVLMCMGATSNAAGLMATRFFLGFMEAAVAPGFSIITSMWYTRSEQPIRNGIWFLGNVVSGFFGGPLMYAFGHVQTFSPWRLLFLVFGGVTIVWGLILFFILPDTPEKAWFLAEIDHGKAVTRVKEDTDAIKHDEWKKEQMFEALRDPKAWLAVIIMLSANIPNGGISSFAAIVINGFGFSVNETFLVNMIVTAFQGIFIIVAVVGSTYLKNTRTLWMVLCTIVGLIGAVMIRQLDNSHIWARYFGYCLLSAYTANFPMVLVMNMANNAGITKKTTVNAMSFIAYCVGNIIGPQLFFSREAPSYPSGFAAMLVCFVVCILAILSLRFYLVWENKRRDRTYGSVTAGTQATAEDLAADKTDHEMQYYRYVY